jgi:hypothetical protein
LTPTNETAAFRVQERPTELKVEATHIDNRVLSVSGELAVPNGPSVPDRTVALRVNGTAIGTTTTGPNGTFETTVIAPESVTSGGGFASVYTISIEAVYENDDANLGSSTGRATARLPVGSLWDWLPIAAIPALLVISVGMAWRWWRRDQRRSVEASDESTGWQASVAETASAESLLTQARNALAEDQSVVAVKLIYATLRTHLETEYGSHDAQTHWEFYRRCEVPDDDTLATLRDATEVYERVVFAAEAVSSEAVAPLLDRTERLVNTDSDR